LALIASDISRPVITLAPTALNGTRCNAARTREEEKLEALRNGYAVLKNLTTSLDVSKLLSGSGQADKVSADFPEPGCHVRIVDRSVGGLELLVGEELARDPVYFG